MGLVEGNSGPRTSFPAVIAPECLLRATRWIRFGVCALHQCPAHAARAAVSRYGAPCTNPTIQTVSSTVICVCHF